MTNNDAVVADENVFDDEPHDSLSFDDIKRIGGATQATQERSEGFGKAQEILAIVGLIGNCLQFGPQALFVLPQHRHALTQLLDREQQLPASRHMFVLEARPRLDTVRLTRMNLN